MWNIDIFCNDSPTDRKTWSYIKLLNAVTDEFTITELLLLYTTSLCMHTQNARVLNENFYALHTEKFILSKKEHSNL